MSTRHARSGALALLVAGLLVGCATRSELLLHRAHRLSYRLGDSELKEVQFYLSIDVLARAVDGGTPDVVLVREGTPGVAAEVGPTWIRVRFQTGGIGVPFVANEGASDSAYFLGTEVPDRDGFHRLKELPDQPLRIGGRNFELVYGRDAQLRIDSGDLAKLIERRVLGEGVRRK